MSGLDFGSEGAVASIDMLIGTSIFLFAFLTVMYLMASTPVTTDVQQLELQSASSRVAEVLVEDGGWLGPVNETSRVEPSDGGLRLERTGNESAGDVNWEAEWNSSKEEVGRIGFMARVEGQGSEPGGASFGNTSYPKVLSIYKVDGVYNDTYGTRGLMLRHPRSSLDEAHGALGARLESGNETWWWDFGEDASYDVSASEDDVSAAEYENATRALGLDYRGYDIYLQLRPLNSSLYNKSAADSAAEKNVPKLGKVAKFERTAMLLYYDSGSDAWKYLKKTKTEPVRYRLVVYLW